MRRREAKSPVEQGNLSRASLRRSLSRCQPVGEGGFGRTYLAEDTNRFSELCVLKEFAPVQSAYVLEKEEMFEAGVLYKLQHPQIPLPRIVPGQFG